MKINAELKFKHGRMVKFLQDNKMDIKALALLSEISEATIGNFIRFKTRLLQPTREKLFNTIKIFNPDILKEELFPEDLNKAIEVFGEKRTVIKEIDLSNAIPINEVSGYLNYTDNNIENVERKDLVKRLCSILNSREKRIIEMSFGLNGNIESTYEEIGKELKLSRERIRQIITRTLRKLIRDERSKMITDNIENVVNNVNDINIISNASLSKYVKAQISYRISQYSSIFKRWIIETIGNKYLFKNNTLNKKDIIYDLIMNTYKGNIYNYFSEYKTFLESELKKVDKEEEKEAIEKWGKNGLMYLKEKKEREACEKKDKPIKELVHKIDLMGTNEFKENYLKEAQDKIVKIVKEKGYLTMLALKFVIDGCSVDFDVDYLEDLEKNNPGFKENWIKQIRERASQ